MEARDNQAAMASRGRPFSELEEDFVRIVRETVFCTVTTVGEDGRPRNRMLHPVFVVRDGPPLGIRSSRPCASSPGGFRSCAARSTPSAT
jgi:hypothetical protein